MGIASTGYKIVLLLHILFAIIGFGTVFLNGIYGAETKKRRGGEGLAIFQATKRVSNVALIFILLVPLWGVGLVMMSDDAWSFGQTWIWLSIVVYVAAISVSFGLLRPAVGRQESYMKELIATPPGAAGGPPPQIAQLEANGKKLAAFSGILHLALVTILVLMIWKPGV